MIMLTNNDNIMTVTVTMIMLNDNATVNQN